MDPLSDDGKPNEAHHAIPGNPLNGPLVKMEESFATWLQSPWGIGLGGCLLFLVSAVLVFMAAYFGLSWKQARRMRVRPVVEDQSAPAVWL